MEVDIIHNDIIIYSICNILYFTILIVAIILNIPMYVLQIELFSYG